jgi:hypothetical protein
MTIAHALSVMLATETKPGPQPRQCAWCNRFYMPDGTFVPAPFIVRNLSHGICRSCFRTKKAEIQAMRATR